MIKLMSAVYHVFVEMEEMVPRSAMMARRGVRVLRRPPEPAWPVLSVIISILVLYEHVSCESLTALSGHFNAALVFLCNQIIHFHCLNIVRSSSP